MTKSDADARFSNEKTLRNAESIDSFHHDEAARVLVNYVAAGGPEEWSSLEEKNLIRKVDRRLLPVLGFTFFLMWYDKGILSQAVSIRSPPPPPLSPNLSPLSCCQYSTSRQSQMADAASDARRSLV